MSHITIRFAAAVLGIAIPVLAAGQTAADQPASKNVPPHRLLKAGAAVGGVLMAALGAMEIHDCGRGCEAGDGSLLLIGLLGTAGMGIGAGLGHLADEYPASGAHPNRFFPSRPTGRVGFTAGQLKLQSPQVGGTAAARSGSAVWQVSPYVSAHVEYAHTSGRFAAKPGAVSQEVLDNLIPAPSRSAGRSFGIESRNVKHVMSELIGVHPPPLGRLRVEFLAGLGEMAQESRNYYDEKRTIDGKTVSTGKYYVLDFHTPKMGAVVGVDAEVAIVPGVSIVPTFRYNRIGDPTGSRMFGVGAHWRF